MITEPQSLRARLLDAEPVSPAHRGRLEKEINDMLNYTLSRRGYWYWRSSFAAAVGFAIFGACVLYFCKMDRFIQAIWWMYTLGNAGFAIVAARILRSGRLDIQQLLIWAKLSPALTLIITLITFVRAVRKPTLEAVLWVLFGMIFLLLATAIIVYNRIVASEMRQREHVLRMELRLEDLIERLGGEEGRGVTADIR